MPNFALDGIKVVSMAYLYPGPYCTMVLADLGAEVIVVEPPGGDIARGGIPGMYPSYNRNKKSMVVDVKKEQGRKIIDQLIEKSEVFLEGFRPGVAEKLGVGYTHMKEINPRIIYCSISGFGQDSPYRDRSAHDSTYQGIAGTLGYAGEPSPPDIAASDLSSGLFAAIAILAAVIARGKTGKGEYIDIAMADCVLSLNCAPIGIYLATGAKKRVARAGGGVFKTKDNRYLTISIAPENHFWQKLCRLFEWKELEDLSYGERTKIANDINAKIAEIISSRNLDEWIKTFTEKDIPHGPVLSLDEVVKDPHFLHRGMFTEIQDADGNQTKQIRNPIRYSTMDVGIRMPPPKLGQHSSDILRSMGYSEDEISALRQSGIIG